MTIRAHLAYQVQRLAEVSERPGRLTEVLDIAELSLRSGIPADAVAGLLNGECLPEGPDDALETLLKELQSLERALEVGPATATLEEQIRCGRSMTSARRQALAEWARSLLDRPRPYGQDG